MSLLREIKRAYSVLLLSLASFGLGLCVELDPLKNNTGTILLVSPMKTALAYSRQFPVGFANQVEYLMKLLVTLIRTYADSSLCLRPLVHFLSSFLPLSTVPPTLLLASGIS